MRHGDEKLNKFNVSGQLPNLEVTGSNPVGVTNQELTQAPQSHGPLVPEADILPCSLKCEIARGQFNKAGKLDLEIGLPVAIDVALDDGFVVSGARLVVLHVMQFTLLVVKVVVGDELKCLVAGDPRFGINTGEIDVVDALVEIGNHIA